MQIKFRPYYPKLAIVFASLSILGMASKSVRENAAAINPIAKTDLQKLFQSPKENLSTRNLPSEINLSIRGVNTPAIIQYTFDATLQNEVQSLYDLYAPDYGSFVAIEAKTGRVLAMVNYSRRKTTENLALKATYPAASVFKMITAAAAISKKKLSPDSVIPYNGQNHTLYKRNVMTTQFNRWTRHITLKEAFAHSVNTVFAKIGAFTVGAQELRDIANRFYFNRPLNFEFPVQSAQAPIPDDPWGLAEAASGFTRDNTLSPLQGAMMAAAIVNDGMMMEPFVVESVHEASGASLYKSQASTLGQAVDKDTAREMRELMRETVTHGTSKKSFRGFFQGRFAQADVGGKTGSLTGLNPRGKYDWFVGYAEFEGKQIAFASLSIHETYWRIKSAYLARKAIETYFSRGSQEEPTHVAYHRVRRRTIN